MGFYGNLIPQDIETLPLFRNIEGLTIYNFKKPNFRSAK